MAFVGPDTVAALVLLGNVVQLRVEREHVQVQGLSLNGFHSRIHVTDKLTGSGSGRMHPDTDNRPFQGFALLRLCRGSPFGSALLVAVHRLYQALVSLNHRVGNLLVELLHDVLTGSRVTDDEDAVVQTAHGFRLVPDYKETEKELLHLFRFVFHIFPFRTYSTNIQLFFL